MINQIQALKTLYRHKNCLTSFGLVIIYYWYTERIDPQAHQSLFGIVLITIIGALTIQYLFTDYNKIQKQKNTRSNLKEQYYWCRYKILAVFFKCSGSSNFPSHKILLIPREFESFFLHQFEDHKGLNNWDFIMGQLNQESVREIIRHLNLFRENILAIKDCFDPLPPYLQKLSNNIHNISDITHVNDQCAELNVTLWYFFTGATINSSAVPSNNPIEKEIDEM